MIGGGGARSPSIGRQTLSLSLFSPRFFSTPSIHSLSTPNSSRLITSSKLGLDLNHYQMKPIKYWNNFYKRHNNKFFKDRHYLEKDWAHYFSLNPNSPNSSKVILEVGCGAGNTLFPLISAFPHLFIHACDLSSNAIELVKSHGDFREDKVQAFVCDVTKNDLCETIIPSSVDVVTLIFTLSAVSPEKMPLVLQNIKKVLKPNGYVLFRDYAIGDFAQEKLMLRNQMISENFYVRGDGTCAYYFSEDFLSSLFKQGGFDPVEVDVYCKQIENRHRNIIMDRRWIRAVFCNVDGSKHQATTITAP